MPISLTEIDKFNENYDIIFDTLGLTEDEKREVYWAVCELVKIDWKREGVLSEGIREIIRKYKISGLSTKNL